MKRTDRYMSSFFGIILVASLIIVVAAQPLKIPDMDQYIYRNMDVFRVPGMAMAVVKDGRIVFLKGYGVLQFGTYKKVDENTLFAIGSISKSTTAIALAMLEDEQKLSWSDPVTKYLPEFQMYDPWVTREMTITDLLTHRSGLRSVSGGTIWYGSDFSREDLIYRLRYLKPVSSFRSEYAYQNVMYVVAGQIIPAITGKTWEIYIRQYLLDPLDMNRTTTTMSELSRMDNVAEPHIIKDDALMVVPHRDYDNIGPAASVYSSVRDMARYVRCLLDSGRYKSRQILSKENVTEIFSPHVTLPIPRYSGRMARRQPQFRAYGFGWFLEDYQGVKIIRHSGGVDGFRALVAMIPAENLGFVILTNQEEYRMYYTVFYKMLDYYLGFPDYHWHEVFQNDKRRTVDEEITEKQKNAPMSLTLDQYAGVYHDRMVGDFMVDIEDNHLVLRSSHTPSFTADLNHWHYNTFQLNWRDPTIPHGFLTFELNSDGFVSGIKLDQPNLLDVDFRELEIIRK